MQVLLPSFSQDLYIGTKWDAPGSALITSQRPEFLIITHIKNFLHIKQNAFIIFPLFTGYHLTVV